MPITQLAQYSISKLQILDEQGKPDAELEPDLGQEQLCQLYESMVLARQADQRMLKLQRQGRLGTFPPCSGQEAASCGAAFAMGPSDWFVGSYRELGGRLVRGESLKSTLLYYNGFEEGSVEGSQKRILPTQVILASQLLHAVGIAYSMRYLGEKESAVVAFFGDGASSQGDFHEALNFAAVWQVPVVFICQNNGWAISVPQRAQMHSKTIAQKAIAYGMPGIQVDGNDALAVYRATQEALVRAKSGGGPTLVEAVTYRLMMHTTADDPKKYRAASEEEGWWKREPLTRFRKYLVLKGIWDETKQAALEEKVKETVDQAVQDFEAPQDIKPDAPFDFVFASRHQVIEAQRVEFLEHLAKEKKEGQHA